MTSTRLHNLAGVELKVSVDGNSVSLSAESWGRLLEHAELWHHAGCPDPVWWSTQSPVEQLALAEAGRRVWAQRAAEFAQAAGAPISSWARVMSRKDGGLSWARAKLASAADRAAAATSGVEVRR